MSQAISGVNQPVTEARRIESLDVLRGFALLGILLLNILGFGMLYTAFFNPAIDLVDGSSVDIATWAVVELFAEGAMRCMFSILFGAGVVLFTIGGRVKSGWLHYKRTFWLLAFGLFDGFVLLWNGDILVTYALAGALLYWFRNLQPRWLIVMSAMLIVAMSLFSGVTGFGIGLARQAAMEVAEAEDPNSVSEGTRQAAAAWDDFANDFLPSDEANAAELVERRDSYVSAFLWNAKKTTEMLFFVIPVFMFWDALAMMLIGMAMFKAGVLQGERSDAFYQRMIFIGFGVGLATNGFEVAGGLRTNFDMLSTFAPMRPTYHLGRLAMACGWIGLVVLFSKSNYFRRLQGMLASVGRMALTNYLMHSLIAAILFTGAGFALIGSLSRAALYPIVFGIWIMQLFLSEWWMKRFYFGPLEWLWRLLTYGRRPPLRRTSGT